MANQYAKVKRSLLAECLTCPLCLNLLRDATTICVCLHTFCRECIYQKLEEDETYSCPICNVYLGCMAREKLRPDNNLQDVRMKIFPLKKLKEIDVGPIPTGPSRRKERSLSSIVISTDPISTTGHASKAKIAARKAGISRGGGNKNHGDKDFSDVDKGDAFDQPYKLSMPSKRKRITIEDEAVNISECGVEPPIQDSFSKSANDTNWDKLNFLAETADKTKVEDSSAHFIEGKEPGKSSSNINRRFRKRGNGSAAAVQKKESNKVMEERCKSDVNDTDKVSRTRKPRKNGVQVNGFSEKLTNHLRPVWFALFAREDQSGASFPQIPKCYIRIKDGNIPVSYVKQYLVQKLNLKHESEVEVTCCGHSVGPSFPLHDVVDIWVRNLTGGGEAIRTLKKDDKGCDVPDYVMVLNYSRKPA
ncbi:E3 ubiquitin protein ligase DRIP2-like [Nymphaea colorata]|nr:E3 ubiquitin protein ligase DRIP2-like [Nymphaea colorata]